MLWQRSLVMIDDESESLWCHLLGQAMKGPLTGESLKTIPSVMTDWRTWRDEHPDTTAVAMSRLADRYRINWYRTPERFVIGLADEKTSRAWNFADLHKTNVINDVFDDVQVLVLFAPDTSTAIVYDRRLNDTTLTFEMRDGKLFDREFGSQWNLVTGAAVDGRLEGQRLNKLPAIVSFDIAWQKFHPFSTYWQAQ